VAYLVTNDAGETMDAWGQLSPEALERTVLFRQRVVRGSFDGAHVLETLKGLRLLSVVRPDDWFVHVELAAEAEVVGVLAVLGGR
jgi:hypothetical protein